MNLAQQKLKSAMARAKVMHELAMQSDPAYRARFEEICAACGAPDREKTKKE